MELLFPPSSFGTENQQVMPTKKNQSFDNKNNQEQKTKIRISNLVRESERQQFEEDLQEVQKSGHRRFQSAKIKNFSFSNQNLVVSSKQFAESKQIIYDEDPIAQNTMRLMVPSSIVEKQRAPLTQEDSVNNHNIAVSRNSNASSKPSSILKLKSSNYSQSSQIDNQVSGEDNTPKSMQYWKNFQVQPSKSLNMNKGGHRRIVSQLSSKEPWPQSSPMFAREQSK